MAQGRDGGLTAASPSCPRPPSLFYIVNEENEGEERLKNNTGPVSEGRGCDDIIPL